MKQFRTLALVSFVAAVMPAGGARCDVDYTAYTARELDIHHRMTETLDVPHVKWAISL